MFKNKILFIFFAYNLFFIHFSTAQQIVDPENKDSVQVLNLLFVGDVMGHKPQIKSAEVIANKKYNYEPCFQYVAPIIRKADLAIGNLEVTLPGAPPYQGYPRFRSPDDLAKALRLAGFDMMTTANNHSNDAKKKGVIHTIETLKEYGFYHTGTFRNQEERDLYYPLIVYKNGFKIAFLNYTYDTNGIPTQAPTVVNEIDTTLIKKDMEAAHQLQPDIIIVLMHWGLEYQLIESPVQRRLTEKIFSWGADLVIGGHPHVVQPIKETLIKKKDGSTHKKIVTYSLGNFISNQNKDNTDGGLMFEVELVKNQQTGKVTLGEHHYIPVWRYIHKNNLGKVTYYTLPISAFENEKNKELAMSDQSKKEMLNFAKKTRKHLNKFDSSERIIDYSELKQNNKVLVKKED